MTRLTLTSGVGYQAPLGKTPSDAARFRALLDQLGLPSDQILDPLTMTSLGKIYGELNDKYDTHLNAKRDLPELRDGIALAAGTHQAGIVLNIEDLVRAAEALRAAVETLAEWAQSEIKTGMVQDLSHATSSPLILNALEGKDGALGAWERLRIAEILLSPLLPRLGELLVDLADFKGRGGRPDQRAILYFCRACIDAATHAKAPLSFSNDPVTDRPGLLVDMALALQRFLPKKLQSNKGAAWAQRFRTALRG